MYCQVSLKSIKPLLNDARTKYYGQTKLFSLSILVICLLKRKNNTYMNFQVPEQQAHKNLILFTQTQNMVIK